MLQLALQISNIPVKELAIDARCSPDTWYAVFRGVRNIPAHCKKKVAQKGFMFMLALALDATGCKIFTYQKINRDIQNLFTGLEIQDEEATELLKKLRKILWNKNGREELSEKDVEALELTVRSIITRLCAEFNLLMEFEAKYGINLVVHMQSEKKELPALQSRQ